MKLINRVCGHFNEMTLTVVGYTIIYIYNIYIYIYIYLYIYIIIYIWEHIWEKGPIGN